MTSPPSPGAVLDTDARAARVAELKDERVRLTRDLIEIDRELAQFGERPGFDAFKTSVAGYTVAILLDERLAECNSRSVREDVALVFTEAAKWMRKDGVLT